MFSRKLSWLSSEQRFVSMAICISFHNKVSLHNKSCLKTRQYSVIMFFLTFFLNKRSFLKQDIFIFNKSIEVSNVGTGKEGRGAIGSLLSLNSTKNVVSLNE